MRRLVSSAQSPCSRCQSGTELLIGGVVENASAPPHRSYGVLPTDSVRFGFPEGGKCYNTLITRTLVFAVRLGSSTSDCPQTSSVLRRTCPSPSSAGCSFSTPPPLWSTSALRLGVDPFPRQFWSGKLWRCFISTCVIDCIIFIVFYDLLWICLF